MRSSRWIHWAANLMNRLMVPDTVTQYCKCIITYALGGLV